MGLLNGLVLALTASSGGAFEDTQTWRFKALLGDREIGEHQFQVGRQGSAVHVRSEADFAVKFLLFKAFGYEHTSAERYEDGCLISLNAATETGGERTEVSATSSAGVLEVRGADAVAQLEGCVSTFAYWNPEQLLSKNQLLNPQTGELVDVKIAPTEKDVAAKVYEISGEGLNIRVIYNADSGEWVGLESELDDGKTLRYVPVASGGE